MSSVKEQKRSTQVNCSALTVTSQAGSDMARMRRMSFIFITTASIPRRRTSEQGKKFAKRPIFTLARRWRLGYNYVKLCTLEVMPMKCPFCGYTESRVIDSRPAEEVVSEVLSLSPELSARAEGRLS